MQWKNVRGAMSTSFGALLEHVMPKSELDQVNNAKYAFFFDKIVLNIINCFVH